LLAPDLAQWNIPSHSRN